MKFRYYITDTFDGCIVGTNARRRLMNLPPAKMGALAWHCAPHSITPQRAIPAGTQMLVGHTITRAELTYCPELLYVSHEVPQAEVAQAERLVERRGLLRRAFGPSSSD